MVRLVAGDRERRRSGDDVPGRELLTAHVPAVVDAIERWLTGALTPEQLTALLDALHAIRRVVRPDAAAGAED